MKQDQKQETTAAEASSNGKKGFHLGKRRSPEHQGSTWTGVYFFGSLKLAMALFLILIIAMAWGTIEESRFDARVAQHKIYNSLWFTFWLIVLCLNLACATFTRLPWKKKHVGFIVTHLGIILLLIGAMIGKHFGIEGSMTLRVDEGPKDRLFLNEMALQFWEPNARQVYRTEFPVDLSPPSEKRPRIYPVPGYAESNLRAALDRFLRRPPSEPSMVFDRYAANVLKEESLEPAPGSGVPGVELHIHSLMMGEHMDVKLIRDPADKSYYQLAGLAQISLADEIEEGFEGLDESTPLLQLAVQEDGRLAYHAVDSGGNTVEGIAAEGERFDTGWADWEVEVRGILPDARWESEISETYSNDPNRLGFPAVRGWLDWGDGRRTEPEWYLAGDTHTVNLDEHLVYFGFGFREERLPFTVELTNFEVPRDPGTDNPADYASYLRFTDPQTGETAEGSCSMNTPAIFPKGFNRLVTGLTYKFSQASWNPEDLNESTVQVLRDPGWLLKWLGSLIIVCGIFTIFFLRPYRSRRPEDFIDDDEVSPEPESDAGDQEKSKEERRSSRAKESNEPILVAKDHD